MEQGQEVQVTGHAHLIEMHPDKDLKGHYGHLGLGDTGECRKKRETKAMSDIAEE